MKQPQGWTVDLDDLPGPDREKWAGWLEDHFQANRPNSTMAVLYSYTEIAMMWYVGGLAVFENRKAPTRVFSMQGPACCYSGKNSLTWLDKKLLAFRAYATKRNTREVPFGLIDLEARKFSWIAMPNAYGYDLRLSKGVVRLTRVDKDERYPSFDRRAYPLAKLKWFPLGKLRSFSRLYFAK